MATPAFFNASMANAWSITSPSKRPVVASYAALIPATRSTPPKLVGSCPVATAASVNFASVPVPAAVLACVARKSSGDGVAQVLTSSPTAAAANTTSTVAPTLLPSLNPSLTPPSACTCSRSHATAACKSAAASVGNANTNTSANAINTDLNCRIPLPPLLLVDWQPTNKKPSPAYADGEGACWRKAPFPFREGDWSAARRRRPGLSAKAESQLRDSAGFSPDFPERRLCLRCSVVAACRSISAVEVVSKHHAGYRRRVWFHLSAHEPASP